MKHHIWSGQLNVREHGPKGSEISMNVGHDSNPHAGNSILVIIIELAP
jgi:hypothetical protein